MAQFLAWINVTGGLILFFTMSGITSWAMFQTPQAKIFPFIIGVLLLGNGVYIALGKASGWMQHR